MADTISRMCVLIKQDMDGLLADRQTDRQIHIVSALRSFSILEGVGYLMMNRS